MRQWVRHQSQSQPLAETFIDGLVLVIKRSHMFFHSLTFAGSRGSCLNKMPLCRVFKHRLRDPASVNAMKQTFVIIILAYSTSFQPKPHYKRHLII